MLDPKASAGWSGADYIESRRVGDAWLLTVKTAILLVPSVVFDVERNALINPAHAETARIGIAGIEAIRWDDRLFSRLLLRPARAAIVSSCCAPT